MYDLCNIKYVWILFSHPSSLFYHFKLPEILGEDSYAEMNSTKSLYLFMIQLLDIPFSKNFCNEITTAIQQNNVNVITFGSIMLLTLPIFLNENKSNNRLETGFQLVQPSHQRIDKSSALDETNFMEKIQSILIVYETFFQNV